MTDQELQQAFWEMSRETFEELINSQNLRLVVDTQSIGSHSPLFSVESSVVVPIKERRKPLFIPEYPAVVYE